MSLSYTSISKVHGSGCNHFELTGNVDGQTVTKQVHEDEIMSMLDDFPGGYRGALMLAWARYQLENGATKSRLIGVDIAPLVP
jgi:hypothetical protein